MSATLTDPGRPLNHIMDPVTVSGEPPSYKSDEHLQRFVNAKSQIISVYKDMSSHVCEVGRCIHLPNIPNTKILLAVASQVPGNFRRITLDSVPVRRH